MTFPGVLCTNIPYEGHFELLRKQSFVVGVETFLNSAFHFFFFLNCITTSIKRANLNVNPVILSNIWGRFPGKQTLKQIYFQEVYCIMSQDQHLWERQG